MKICILSHDYEPSSGPIATYHNAAARILAAAGHEVHVVTNLANHGSRAPEHTHRLWSDGNLTIHRLPLFDERGGTLRGTQFLDVVPQRYGDQKLLWAGDPSNTAALQLAAYIEQLHLDVGVDVVESPDCFAEAFYMIRARHSGRRASFPPVCVHAHGSPWIATQTNWQHDDPLPDRQRAMREQYCVQNADALLAPSPALMRRYRERFGESLPELQRTIPYFHEPATDAKQLVEQKLELFEAMLDREALCRVTLLDRFFLPPALHPLDAPPPLPGKGVVVIDAGGEPADRSGATFASINDELRGSPTYRVTVLREPAQSIEVPDGWTTTTMFEPPQWLALGDDEMVIWVLAGVRLDFGFLRYLTCQASDSRWPCGSFAWLRPASARVFPYSPDFGFEDLLTGAHAVPPAFAIKARHLRTVSSLSGLPTPHQRLVALLCAASGSGEMRMQHTGSVLGDFYGDLPLVTTDIRLRTIGFLEQTGIIAPGSCRIGDLVEVPNAPVAPLSGANQGDVAAKAQLAAAVANSSSPVADIATLERVYYEHMRLKQLGVVRLLRKLGIFGLVRKIVPGSKRFFGPGR